MRESYQYGTLVQTRTSWFLRYYEYDLKGHRTQRSEKIGSLVQFPTKARADKAADSIRKRINEPKPVVKFSELADRYVEDELPKLRLHTQKTNRGNLKYLLAKFGERRLDSITPGEVELWVNALASKSGKPLSRGTRKHVRNLMHNLWRHAMLWGYLTQNGNPMDIVRVSQGAREKVRSVVIEADAYSRLINDPQLIPVAKVMVQVAMTTGMGVSEILGLRWEDFDWQKGVIHVLRSVDGKEVSETKNEFRQNDVPMHPTLAQALKAWRKTDEGDIGGWVFGSPYTDMPYHASTMLADHLKPAAKRAGCPNLGWHSFRHTFSAEMDLTGASDRVQQRAMRHGNAGMTKRYGKHSPALFEKAREAQDAVVRKLG